MRILPHPAHTNEEFNQSKIFGESSIVKGSAAPIVGRVTGDASLDKNTSNLKLQHHKCKA